VGSPVQDLTIHKCPFPKLGPYSGFNNAPVSSRRTGSLQYFLQPGVHARVPGTGPSGPPYVLPSFFQRLMPLTASLHVLKTAVASVLPPGYSPYSGKKPGASPPVAERSPIYSGRFFWTDAGKYVPQADIAENEKLGNLPPEVMQNSRSAASGHSVSDAGAARYFDYATAVALRNLAARFGTAMPRYLLAPEISLLLAAELNQRRRLLIETFWNTGGRLNEVTPLALLQI